VIPLYRLKPAITKMAQMLAAYPENFNMEDPEVEMEDEVEVADVAEDSEKKAKEEVCEDFMFAMEEDPEMYVAAGLPPPPCAPPHVKRLGLRCHCQSCDEFCRRDEGRECEHQSRCCQWEF
jgi:hypothetical protein